MASTRSRIIVPTTAALAHSLRLPSTNQRVLKTLGRVARDSLLELVLDWLDDEEQSRCGPYLLQEDGQDGQDSVYPPATSLEEVKQVYLDFQSKKGLKREVVDRMTEGDWRHGITLYQLAMVDLRYLLDHPTSQRWTAMKLSKTKPPSNDYNLLSADAIMLKETEDLPRFHAPTFLQNLQNEISFVVKAHYYMTRINSPPLTLLRIYIHDSPYNNAASLFDSSGPSSEGGKTLYIAFPDGAPFVYVSIGTEPGQPAGGEGRSLRRVVIDGIPKALSKPGARYTLQPTSFHTKSLSTLFSLKGPGRGSGAAGGWSIFADGTVEDTPLNDTRPNAGKRKGSEDTGDEDHDSNEGDAERRAKRSRLLAAGRFGNSGIQNDGKALENFTVTIEDPFPPASADVATPEADNDWKPRVRFGFHGTHVFAGIRRLAEAGVVDAERMPGWMTGEANVSIGVVRHGRVRGDAARGS